MSRAWTPTNASNPFSAFSALALNCACLVLIFALSSSVSSRSLEALRKNCFFYFGLCLFCSVVIFSIKHKINQITIPFFSISWGEVFDFKQSFTQYGGSRPFGTALLIGGAELEMLTRQFHESISAWSSASCHVSASPSSAVSSAADAASSGNALGSPHDAACTAAGPRRAASRPLAHQPARPTRPSARSRAAALTTELRLALVM